MIQLNFLNKATTLSSVKQKNMIKKFYFFIIIKVQAMRLEDYLELLMNILC